MDPAIFERLRLQHLATELNAIHAEWIDDDRCDSKGMLVDRIISLRKANIFPVHSYRHILGPTRIVSEHELKITAQTNYTVFMTRADGRTEIYNSGKYIDEIDCSGEKPLFTSKVAVFDTNVIDTMMVRPI